MNISRYIGAANFIVTNMRGSILIFLNLSDTIKLGMNSYVFVFVATTISVLAICAIAILRAVFKQKEEKKKTDQLINELKLENQMNTDIGNHIVVEEHTRDRFVMADELVLFTYLPDNRRWQVLLKDESTCLMKRDFRAEKILEISPNFTKLNQQTIVNVDYIKSIGTKDQSCILKEPFDNIELFFSRRIFRQVKGHHLL